MTRSLKSQIRKKYDRKNLTKEQYTPEMFQLGKKKEIISGFLSLVCLHMRGILIVKREASALP